MSVAENFYTYTSYENHTYVKQTTLYWRLENEITAYAYYGFEQIETLHLSKSSSIGEGAFMCLTNLKEIWFHNNNVSNWNSMFEDFSANPLCNSSVEKFYVDYGYGSITTNWQEIENFREVLKWE